MITNLRRVVRNAFGIYPGESRNAFRFIRLAFIIAFATSIADTMSIGLFLEHVGADKLPITYAVSAFTMFVFFSLFLYFLRIFSSYKILLNVMLIATCCYAFFAFVIQAHPPNWLFLALQIFTIGYIASITASFWTFFDTYHDLQDAKRIYAVYNAAYFLGYVISGILINLLIDKLGTFTLFALIPAALMLAIFEARSIVNKVPVIEEDITESFLYSGKKSLFTIIKLFATSPYAIVLVSMCFIVQTLRNSTEFSYMETFQKIFVPHISSPDAVSQNTIVEFLAKCKAYIAGGNIIIGMFFYRRMVRKINLGNMIILTPIYFLMVYFEWVTYDSLFVAILAVVAIEGVLCSVSDNNYNLLINAAPTKLRGILRITNDFFFEPTGMLFSSAFLMLFKSQSRWFGLCLAIIFLTIALILKNIYPKAIFISLQQNALHFERKVFDWFSKLNKKEQKEIKQDIIEALDSKDEEKQLMAIESLLSFNDPYDLSKAIYYINKFADHKKIQILSLLEKSPLSSDSKIIEMIDSWLDEASSEDLIKHANLYLAKKGFLHPQKVMNDLDSDDLYARGSAIITLKKSLANSSLVNAALNKTIAAKETELLLKFEDEDEICMGLEILSEDKGAGAIETILKFLMHSSLKIKKMAAKSLSMIATKFDSRYAPKIIEELNQSSDSEVRLHCLTALGKMADSTTVKEIILAGSLFRPNERRLTETIIMQMGLKTVPILLSITKDVTLHERSRILAGKILGKLSIAQLKANLSDIISEEIQRAYFYFYYGNTIQKNYPSLDLSLLQNGLVSNFQSVIDFIIHLVGAAGPIEDVDLIVRTLRGKNEKAHAHAIETLEKNCDEKIFLEIAPLIEDTPKEHKLDVFLKIHEEKSKLSLEEILNKLESSPSFLDKIIAAHLKAKLHMPHWKQSLREQIKTSDESFHHFAYELLE
ncbi:MAG: MFS transporter [Chlamydiae bacterium]|nr:MFS transporter [Chlamydiota bacterium]